MGIADTATTPTLAEAVRLRRSYDPERLRDDLASVINVDWKGQRGFEDSGVSEETDTDWRVLPLRSIGGQMDRTDPGGAGLCGFSDTPLLSRLPYLADALSRLPGELRSARLMSVGPNVAIEEHRDRCGFAYGTIRLHVPVTTNAGAVLVIDGATHRWQPGELWYADFARYHSIRNDGAEARVHLVVDVMVNEQVLTLFPGEYRSQMLQEDLLFCKNPVPLSVEALATFRCSFGIPEFFSAWPSDDDFARAQRGEDKDKQARIEVVNGEPTLLIEDEPAYGLVHIGAGEFRLAGWTDERTLQVDLRLTNQVSVLFRFGGHLRQVSRPAVPSGGAG